MKRLSSVIFLVLLAAVFVQSETRIEIDENGDEYEVKRFNIEGRQLNGGRRQCIETRRKRSTSSPKAYDSKPAESDEEQGLAAIYTLGSAAESDETKAGGDEQENKNNKANEDASDDEEDDAELPNLNDMNKTQSNEENSSESSVPALAPSQQILLASDVPVAIAAAPAALPAIAPLQQQQQNADGIVVVQSDVPPRVNPNTHAVFELVPVQPTAEFLTSGPVDNAGAVVEAEEGDDYDYGIDENGFYNFEEEVSPVTTTAIWSTGEDDDDQAPEPAKPTKPTRPQKYKSKTKKPKRKSHRPGNQIKNKPMRQIKKKNQGNGKRKRPSPTRRPAIKEHDVQKRRQNKRKQQPKRPRPGAVSAHHRVVTTRRRGPNGQATRRVTNKNRAGHRHNGNKKNKLKVDQGSNTFTRTVTFTRDDENDEKVNCIIINKDPAPAATTTTTPRPFWNILGRDVDGRPVASGRYGRRKRVNMRLD